jgi:hypothetical protein
VTTKKIFLIVAGVVLALGLLIVLFVVGIAGIAFYSISNSEAASTARTFLRNSQRLKADIGSVKDFGSLVTGSVNVSNDSGEATLNFKVIGEQKTVNASVELLYLNGRTWRVSAASYVNDKGEKINLLDPYDTKRLVPLLVA